MHAFNAACQYVSDMAWEHHEFHRVPVHHLTYQEVRQRFDLPSQLAVRAIGVVTDSYKADRTKRHTFRPHGAVVYDERVMKLGATTVALRTLTGRESIPWAGGGYQRKQLAAAVKVRQADLTYRADKGRWRLAVTIDVPNVPLLREATDAIGVDQGIVNVATTSDGTLYGGNTVLGLRRRYYHMRRKLQKRRSKSAHRLLRKRSRRERRFMADVNHRLTTQIAQTAQISGRAVGVELLKGIRTRVQVSRRQRRTHSSWAFGQFTAFLAYKCADRGVPFVLVDPRNTSKTCSRCGHCEMANRQSQSSFLCRRCGFAAHADVNGAENIRVKALVVLGAGADQPPRRLGQPTALPADKPPALAGGS
jgi:IS605 OrfB family transposase